jgi:hypothetical protein
MDDQKQSELMLANEHASVTLSSLVYDPAEDNLLVAALAVASATELLVAIKAHLEKHAKKNWLRVVDLAGVEDTLLVRGAGFGYAVAKSPLRKVNARGTAVAFLHRAATDPGLVSCDWFYVVATTDQRGDVPALFIERLMAATYHTILPEWGDYLFKVGLKKKLVADLPILGQPDDFSRALRVERCPEGWQAILSKGLRDGKLKF